MANCLFAFNNRADTSAYSGGYWLANLPLTNLANPIQGVPARSVDLALTSTKFLVDIGADKIARLAALVDHNLSLTAEVRIRASDSDPTMATGVLFDSGWSEVWPSVYDSADVEWENPNFWSGQYTDEERQGYTWNFVRFGPAGFIARYWLIEIDDPDNSAGFVQVGRLFIGDAWQPSINMSYGAGIAWEDPSTVDEAMSGTEFFGERRVYRVARFTISGLGQDEAYGRAFDLQRRVGVTKEVMFIYDPDDTLHAVRRQYRGRLRQLSQIENPTLDVHSIAWEVKELL